MNKPYWRYGNRKLFYNNTRGICLLAAAVDSNGNTTRFERQGNQLPAIIDSSERTTPDSTGIFGGLNLYGAVGNNPITLLDVLGLWGDEGEKAVERDREDDGYNDCCGTETEGDDSEADNDYENGSEIRGMVVTAEREETIVSEI